VFYTRRNNDGSWIPAVNISQNPPNNREVHLPNAKITLDQGIISIWGYGIYGDYSAWFSEYNPLTMGWSPPLLYPGGVSYGGEGFHPMAIDGTGTVYAMTVYNYYGWSIFSKAVGGMWIKDGVTTYSDLMGGYDSDTVGFDANKNGTLHVVFGSAGVKYRCRPINTGGIWQPSQTISSRSGWYPFLMLDKSGGVHIIWQDPNLGLYYTTTSP
jgi:hypothetical protein